MEKNRRVCVTGAGGFAASWLVKLLLSKGFIVHGTVRNPSDEKYAHLKKLENAMQNLILYKADLLDYVSIASAVAGCEGVFHVASPVPPSRVPNPEVEVLEPAVTGTKNVLKASLEAKVKRVVMVSSVSAISMKPDLRSGEVVDESCWSDEQYCRTTENWYCLSKTIAEREAFDFASKNALDIVIVCPSLVIGPMLQSTINASSMILINLLKGRREYGRRRISVPVLKGKVHALLNFALADRLEYDKLEKAENKFSTFLIKILQYLFSFELGTGTGTRETVENTTRNLVDVRDLAEALLLVYEKKEVSGRYIANSHVVNTRDLIRLLKCLFPNYNYPKSIVEVEEGKIYSSKKLQSLTWKFRPLEETLTDAVNSYESAHLLD